MSYMTKLMQIGDSQNWKSLRPRQKKKSKDDASISYQNGILSNDLTICILYLTIVGKRYHQYK